jgi:hypothetical protein
MLDIIETYPCKEYISLYLSHFELFRQSYCTVLAKKASEIIDELFKTHKQAVQPYVSVFLSFFVNNFLIERQLIVKASRVLCQSADYVTFEAKFFVMKALALLLYRNRYLVQ